VFNKLERLQIESHAIMEYERATYQLAKLADGSCAVHRIEADREYALGIYPTRRAADDAAAADAARLAADEADAVSPSQ
jgi:IS5 family transposase